MSNRLEQGLERLSRAILETQQGDGSWGPVLDPIYRVTATSLALCAEPDLPIEERVRAEKFLLDTLLDPSTPEMTRLLAWPLWSAKGPELRQHCQDRLLAIQDPSGGWPHAAAEIAVSLGVPQNAAPSLLPTILAVQGLRSNTGDSSVAAALDRARKWTESLIDEAGRVTLHESSSFPICSRVFALLILLITQSHAANPATPDRIAAGLLSAATRFPVPLEHIPKAGRRFDTPYTLFTPAWLLLGLASCQSPLYGSYVVNLAHYLLSLQRPDGAISRSPGTTDADLYSAGQFAVAIRAALDYLKADVFFDSVILSKPKDAAFTERYDVAVLCALHSPEFSALRAWSSRGVTWEERERDDSHTFWSARVPTSTGRNLDIVASVPTISGPVATAVLTTKMVLRFRPKVVVMVGIAAGTRSTSREYGDILVARDAFDYNSGRLVVDPEKGIILLPDPQPISIDSGLLSLIQASAGNWEGEIRQRWPGPRPKGALDIHVGTIASGSAVVAAKQVVQGIEKHWRKLVGLEMEVYAMYRAAHEALTRPPLFVAIKSVCDYADDTKNDSWQEYASYTSAEYFYRLLAERLATLPVFN